MVRAGLGALPVIDEEQRVVGMVSEREVIRHLLTTQVFSGADVRSALWTERTLVKTFGPRGTVHLLPARDLSRWCAALSELPRPPSPFARSARARVDLGRTRGRPPGSER